MIPRCLLRVKDDRRGISAVEFGLLAPVFLLLLMGSFDLAYQVYVRSVTLGALETLTRAITIEGVDETTAVNQLRSNILIVSPQATIDVDRGSVSRFNQFGAMEPITVDKNGNGQLDTGDCWLDIDDNGSRNAVTLGKDNIGGADDVVRYDITVGFDRLFPLYQLFGQAQRGGVAVSTMIRRQPFEGQKSPPERCK